MPSWNLFGFSFGKKGETTAQQKKNSKNVESFVPPAFDDGSILVDSAGVWATHLDIEGAVRNEFELITRYKDMATYPEVDSAIDDIVNEAIVSDEDQTPVSIVLDDLPKSYSEKTKDQIRDEFDYILRLLNFNNDCYEIFRKWYIDGRSYFHKIIDATRVKEGIQELRNIDPRQIRRVKEIRRMPAAERPSPHVDLVEVVDEYFLFNPRGITLANHNVGMRINLDAITYVHSGVVDKRSKMILSHLHKAIKPHNQLRMIEDAMVIYRLSRAPERRIFYIDVGNLPKAKAEQYIQSIMNKYRNKLVYDGTTGEIKDDKRYLSMMEDMWLPRREGSQGTSVDTLDGAKNLSDIEDVVYFQRKLYKSLNVPITRLDSDTGFSIGRATEITRDELKFTKFINRLRKRFSLLFDDLLRTQLICKGICTADEWDEMKEFIHYDFVSDSYFSELKEAEVMRDRISLASAMGVDKLEGIYFSREYIKRNVLRLTEDEIEENDRQIEDEKAKYEDSQQLLNFAGDNDDVAFPFNKRQKQNKFSKNEDPEKKPKKSAIDNEALKKEVDNEQKVEKK